jgi:hypothetical protein
MNKIPKMDSCHKQDYCMLGIKALTEPVLSGHRPLDELTTENFCLCTNPSKHTWLCSANFHGRHIKLSYADVHKFIAENKKTIERRALLPAEATRLLPRLLKEPEWVYSFYPAIQDNPVFTKAVNYAATYKFNNPASCERMVEIGVSKVSVNGVSSDASEYFAFLRPNKSGNTAIFDKLGKFSWQFFEALRYALQNLPLELVIYIFEIAYNCKLTSKCLQSCALQYVP